MAPTMGSTSIAQTRASPRGGRIGKPIRPPRVHWRGQPRATGCMTEMPEVETLVGDLRATVVGRRIKSADVLLPAAVRFPTVPEFVAQLQDCVVTGVERRAKHILLGLSDELVLGLHMMLWGTLRLVDEA